MARIRSNEDFEEVVSLIENAKNRAFQKVNEELVRLYFTVEVLFLLKFWLEPGVKIR